MTYKALFIGGTINQTSMMIEISKHLNDTDCFFAPIYLDPWQNFIVNFFSLHRFLEKTTVGRSTYNESLELLLQSGMQVDEGGKLGEYDLVFLSTDLYIPRNIRKSDSKKILVQEGATIQSGLAFNLVKRGILPRSFANTASTGLSDAYDLFCVASDGYKDFFVENGVKCEKIEVTGIPNFDDFDIYKDKPQNLPELEAGYVLVCASPSWESSREEWKKLIELAKQEADRRDTYAVFKLHPREKDNIEAAIKSTGVQAFKNGPRAEYYIPGSSIVISQGSTSTFAAVYFEKEIIMARCSLDYFRNLLPWQNEGSSAKHIADKALSLLL